MGTLDQAERLSNNRSDRISSRLTRPPWLPITLNIELLLLGPVWSGLFTLCPCHFPPLILSFCCFLLFLCGSAWHRFTGLDAM